MKVHQHITDDDEEIEMSIYETFPTHIHIEEKNEYNADQTIISRKSTDWIINGIRVRENLTQYQLKNNPPKTRLEYYDVIFFNDYNKDGFLGTLDENIVEQMLNDIRGKEEKTEDNSEHDIKLPLDNVID
ncbi:9810_t:CDS:2 [Funneliformis caledonium]|uniref:9810_t:CDS:1 n=1 Tax=Funneliformis caledonium TaxID=1117310 RepID=A0A9N8VDD2_9GLOM|nr:9810_t:CDS:2 [Funneliformis caledonium]